MTVHLHLMDRGQKLSDSNREKLIRPVRSALSVLQKFAPELDADLVVVPTDIYCDPHWYRSGKAFGPGFAQVEVNTDHPRFARAWEEEGEAIVLHELHHCLRWAHISGPWTIGEIVVLEGLAIMAEGFGSSSRTNYGAPPSDAQLDMLCDRAWEEREQCESEATGWFRSIDVKADTFTSPVNYFIGQVMMERALDRLGLDPFEAAMLQTSVLLEAAR
ncbi:MAG: DUF2268 domain-containing putative Zn-dependent protease [Paracoccaceae bacterium]